METVVFEAWQVYLSTFCIGAAGALAGFVAGTRWQRHRRGVAVKTVIKADGTRETHLMTSATEDEAELLRQMELAADALEAYRETQDDDGDDDDKD